MYKPKKLLLKGLPEDVYAEILRKQSEHKMKYKTQISLEVIIYKIIRSTIKKES